METTNTAGLEIAIRITTNAIRRLERRIGGFVAQGKPELCQEYADAVASLYGRRGDFRTALRTARAA